ncbi:TolC family protein [Mucilaginibacter sp. Bleaf8]|uniref:TolC family protein n=1 Tax=Mucilaginibacter sp. Bleaf8 TaxID=2834430 RepID=UPI001BCB7C3B|nr:TolC family protein [Mucilaginibacter sp. Bleaf8]MBS7565827.1 TolC family protein [Mucilaginibacter sp. Bleaf8]
MSIKHLICLIFCCVAVTGYVKAQNTAQADTATLLTLKDAIEIALKNNYDIKLSRNTVAIANNNVTPGNARMLPTVTGNYTVSNSIQSTTQTRSDSTVNRITRANNTGSTYGVSLNWTVFDGFSMFATYSTLKQRRELSEVQLRDTVQRTVANVINAYYDLVNQNKQIQALQGVIAISRTQFRYANERFKVGRVARLDVYNAQVALNTDTATLLSQLQQYKTSKIELNRLMARNPQTEFAIADTIVVDDRLVLANIINQAQTQNPAILSASINQRISELNLRSIKATRYPQVSVNTGYNFSNSTNPAGFARVQRSNGLNYGLAATINIFDGFNQWRRERNAKLQIENAGFNLSQVRLQIESQITDLYNSYTSGLQLIKLGQANVDLASRTLSISLEKYRLGTITPLEIREAQRNYLNAQSVFFAAQYQSKVAETTLKQIIGNISLQ